MLACICCGTLEIAACVAVATIAPAMLAVLSDRRRRPLDMPAAAPAGNGRIESTDDFSLSEEGGCDGNEG